MFDCAGTRLAVGLAERLVRRSLGDSGAATAGDVWIVFVALWLDGRGSSTLRFSFNSTNVAVANPSAARPKIIRTGGRRRLRTGIGLKRT